MLARPDAFPEALATTDVEAATARTAARRLEQIAKADRDITIHIAGEANVAIPLPAKAVQMMVRILTAMADGKAISLIPHEAELTTKQAADFLNVSRPFVCKLIDEGKLPARLVNRHRRVKFADLVEFERNSKMDRRKAFAEMAEMTRDLGLE